MADAVSESLSGRRETELTSIAISCSRLSFFNAPGEGRESGVWAKARLTKSTSPKAMKVGMRSTGPVAKTQLRALDDGFAISPSALRVDQRHRYRSPIELHSHRSRYC